jgi:signal transduction histidine kinase
MASHGLTSRRFWLVDVVAWTDLAALNFVVLSLAAGRSTWLNVQAAVIDVAPQAVLGLAVLRACRALPWGQPSLGWFVSVHATLGVLYGVVTTAGIHGLFVLRALLVEGRRPPAPFNAEIFGWQSVMGTLLYGVVAGVAYGFELQSRMKEQEARAAKAVALQRQAELEALRAQLHPHFLFNTLHALLSLVRRDPAAAERGIEQLGDLLRHVLRIQRDAVEEVTLEEELRFVRLYLDLERLRLGDRLRVDVRADADVLDERVPAFCLQPLVENAIKHAIAPRAGGGALGIVAERRGEELVLEVTDDGAGATPAALRSGNGLGLRLVRDRLRVLHGEAATLDVSSRPGHGTRAAVRLHVGRGHGPCEAAAP